MTHGALAQLRQLAGLVASAPSLAIYHLAEEARVAGHIDDEPLDAFIARFGHRAGQRAGPTVPVENESPTRARANDRVAHHPASSDPAAGAKHIYERARRQLDQVPPRRHASSSSSASAAKTTPSATSRSSAWHCDSYSTISPTGSTWPTPFAVAG
jgi:hypothetical protein